MFLGQIYIQDHQGWTGRRGVVIRMIEKARGLFAVLGDMHPGLDSRSLDCLPDQKNVCRIILNYQNMRITRRHPLIEGW